MRPARGVVLVVIDTLRKDHLGLYGDERGLTPRLDALAQQAVVFDGFVAASSWTRPSLGAVFTSRHPSALGLHDFTHGLSPVPVTLAEAASAAGVQCLAASANRIAGTRWGFAQGFEVFDEDLPLSSYPGDFGMVSAEQVTTRGLQLLDDRDLDRPFLLFLHYTDPHDPYLRHDGLLNTPEPPGRFGGSRAELSVLDELPEGERTADDEARIRWLYQGEVAWVDHWLGALSDGLVERGLADDVLLVITADHGEELWDHGQRAHGCSLYDELIGAPLLVRWPATHDVEPGRVGAMAGHVDLMPTVLATLGVAPPADLQGRDLLPLTTDDAQAGGQAYAEMRLGEHDLESLSDGRAKLIRQRSLDGVPARGRRHQVRPGDGVASVSQHYFGSHDFIDDIVAANPELLDQSLPPAEVPLVPGTELVLPDADRPPGPRFLWFRLDMDPGEQDNRAESTEALRSPLHRGLQQLSERTRALALPAPSIDLDSLDEDMLRQLRGLGYLGSDG